MPNSKSLALAAILAITVCGSAGAQNSIVVESRDFQPTQAACTLGIWLENDVHVTGIVVPIEARSVSGGAFYVGMSMNPFILNPGMRVDHSPLGSADPGGAWPAANITRRRFENPAAQACGGPVSKTYSTAVGSLSGTSPDGFLFACVATGDGNSGQDVDLDPGADPSVRDSASWIFFFDANGQPGCFEIDTCCISPAGHLSMVDINSQLVAISFNSGMVCIEGTPANLPPVVTCPNDIVEQAQSGETGAIVTYSVTVADEDPLLTADCNPPSGSFFAIGTTLVTCIAADTAGLADTCTFSVTINPPPSNQAPILHCPIHPYANVGPSETGAIINYTVTFTDEDPTLVPNCDPPPGSLFTLGTTMVTCAIADTFGLVDTCVFPVTVTTVQQSSVVIESKTFLPGQTDCKVEVFLANHAPITGFVLPLELRSISGGAYLVTPAGSSVFICQPGNRLDASPLGSPDPNGAWQAASSTRRNLAVPQSTYPTCPSSGDPMISWDVRAASLDGSPDAVSYATVSVGDPDQGDRITLDPGEDPPFTAAASLVFQFDVNMSEGCFTIDTTCVRPFGHISIVNIVNSEFQSVVPSFTAGTICISSCICDCHGNPAVASDPSINLLDVIYITDVAFRGQPDIPDTHPACPVNATDLNCDSVCDIIDVLKIVDVAFRGGDPSTVFCDPCP